MKTIKLITDSASDIPDEELEKLDIDMLHVPIAVDGMEFLERKSFTFQEYYKMLENAAEIPKTSRISQQAYLENYQKNYAIGYKHLIVVAISSTGSGTIDSAIMAREEFFENNPAAKDEIEIHIVDSKSYSMGYGWAVIQAAQYSAEGKDASFILSYLSDWFQNLDIYLACYTLKYAQQSGRINAATAFVGEMLGMRPIINMKDGATYNVAKVRGDKNVVEGIFKMYKKNYTPEDTFVIVSGRNLEPAKELQEMFRKEVKITPPIYSAGACIVTNAGPDLLAIVCNSSKVS